MSEVWFNISVADFWNFQLFIIEGKPITFGKVLLGIVLFVLGYLICKKLSILIEKRLLSRLDIDASLRDSLRKAIFYLLIIFLILFVLRLLSVPLTVFTVLGGALALGVGFGSQNIVNNFISGLIIMIERPVRVGDIVEVGELKGVVVHIGVRSTQIRTMDNTHYVVPNSSFLEKNILNWTLSDDIVRSKVTVGVAYGSDPTQVEQVLLGALKKIKKVLTYPEALVLFNNFADSSLTFELYFWIKVKNLMEMKRLESDVRFKVSEAFTEHGIVIAFPQRDMNIKQTEPLKVEILGSSDHLIKPDTSI